jgi:DNA-binding transcriptional ArsR family regulator
MTRTASLLKASAACRVGEIARHPELSQPAVSHHLSGDNKVRQTANSEATAYPGEPPQQDGEPCQKLYSTS